MLKHVANCRNRYFNSKNVVVLTELSLNNAGRRLWK